MPAPLPIHTPAPDFGPGRAMTDYDAVGIAEGFIEADDEDHVIEAWQHLHDTGLAYRLQGCFGRQAQYLLNEGIIS